MKSAARKRNFHLPLPDETYAALRDVANAANVPATTLAREVIEQWLAERRRMATQRAISDYARRWAGTNVDLDSSLEAAGVALEENSKRVSGTLPSDSLTAIESGLRAALSLD